MTVTLADPMQLWLEISPEIQTSAWEYSQAIPTPGSRWLVYLNQLCLRTVLAELFSEVGLTATSWPALDAQPTSWELVMGSSINVGTTRLVLIPSDGLDHDELQVPQEWVDLIGWVADYYLAVRVNPEEGWVEVWGYTTHQLLKTPEHYDVMERGYCISAEDLTCDLTALWTTLEFCPSAETQTILEPLSSSLSDAQAAQLIQRLARAEVAFPRLSIPFVQWGALLDQESWWQQLCHQRLLALQGEIETIERISLSQCLAGIEGAIATGWQSIEAVFGTNAEQLAFGFRQTEQAVGRQAKNISLVVEANAQSVRLVLLWQLETDGRLAMRVQLYPTEAAQYLPPDIILVLVTDQAEILSSVQSSIDNNYIQLPRFKVSPGDTFGIEIRFGNQCITEYFVV